MNRSLHAAKFAVLFAIAALAANCARGTRVPPTPPPSFRLAVLDFAVPPQWRSTENVDSMKKELRGWWFGSQTRFQNPGMGRLGGDIFAQEMSRLPFATLVSRVAVKEYMAAKLEQIRALRDQQRRELEAAADPKQQQAAARIAAMTESEYEMELERLSPALVGKELNADRVLIGRIHNAYLAHNRAINWYWATVDLELSLVDVDTGRVLWNRRATFRKQFASTSLVLEEAAYRLIDQMKREHFYRPK